MMRSLVIFAASLGLVVAVGGCADTTSATRTAEQPAPTADDVRPPDTNDKVPGYSVSQKDVYDLAKVACDSPPRKVAHDFHMRTTDPFALAERYARGYAAPLRQSAYEGCFDGLSR